MQVNRTKKNTFDIVLKNLSIILKGNGTETNLNGGLITLNIYEDIFSNFLTGKINVVDTHDLQKNFPLIGNENLEITYASSNDDSPKLLNFKIYKLDSDPKVTTSFEHQKIITLYFCSKEMITNSSIAISKKFDGKPNSIVKDLVKNNLKSKKKINTDSVTNKIKYVSNFWKFSKNLNYIYKNSLVNDNPDLLFFENPEGFHFKSLNNLLNKKAKATLEYKENLDQKIVKDYYNKMKMNKYFDLLEFQFGNKIYKYDDENYEFYIEENDFETVSETQNSLGRNLLYDDELKSNHNVQLTYNDEKVVSRRNQIFNALDNYHLILSLKGDSSRTVGQVYDIKFRSFKREELDNELLSGKWLASNINHQIFSDGTYEQNIKFIKNAFSKADTTAVKGKVIT